MRAQEERVSLTRRVQVVDAYGDPKVLRVHIFVPHQKLCAHGDVLEGSVIDVTTVLERKQVLLVYVTCALYESHPAGRFFVSCIEIIQQSSIFVDLT